MATIVSGLVDDSDVLSNEIRVDMSDIVGLLESDFTQFTTALMKLRSKPAQASKVEWLEDQLQPRVFNPSASATSAASSIAAATADGIGLQAGDVLRNEASGEALVVTGISGNSAIGVTRSVGSVAASAVATTDEIVIIGNANLQGADTPTAKTVKRTHNYNYTQIFRHAYSFTRTLNQTATYLGDTEVNYERRKKGIEHKRALEASLFFGARDLITGGSEPQGFMGGLIEYLATNLHSPGGTMTSTELDTYLQTDFQYGGQNKVIFASPTVARVISAYARDNWVRATPDLNAWGIKVDGVISGAYGYNVPVFVKREWGEFDATASNYGTRFFVVDMDKVRLRPLQTTVLLRNRQGNGVDAVTEEYLTETSFEMQNEQAHAMGYGVTA